MDYSKLEGKKVTLDGYECTVKGCDPDVGLTVVRDDGGEHVICLNGPSSPLDVIGSWEDGEGLKVYRAMFDHCIKGIESGTIEGLRAVKSSICGLGDSESNSSSTCAFSQ